MQSIPRGVQRALLALVCALVAACGFGVITLADSPDTATPPVIERELGGPGPTVEITTTPGALNAVKQSEVGEHVDAAIETPSPANEAAQERAAEKDDLPVDAPLAAPTQRGCRSQFVRNRSSRGGIAPRGIRLHYTVSFNRPGWADVNAIVAYFDMASSKVSSNYVFDREGHCAYIVKEIDKAWTQADANPWDVSFEIIAYGSEPNYLPHRAYVKLASIVADIGERWPTIDVTRKSIYRSCRPIRSGINDHRSLGPCGGGHDDISRAFPGAVERLIRYVRAEKARRSKAREELREDARRCLELKRIRGQARRGSWTPHRLARARELKRALGTHREAVCR